MGFTEVFAIVSGSFVRISQLADFTRVDRFVLMFDFYNQSPFEKAISKRNKRQLMRFCFASMLNVGALRFPSLPSEYYIIEVVGRKRSSDVLARCILKS